MVNDDESELAQVPSIKAVKAKIRALARSSGFTEKASLRDFLEWREAERRAEAGVAVTAE